MPLRHPLIVMHSKSRNGGLPNSARQTDVALCGADLGLIGTDLASIVTHGQLRGADRELIDTDHVHIVTDAQFRRADRQPIHTDHVHIVTDRELIGTDHVHIVTDAQLRGADRQPIHTDHVHIVTDGQFGSTERRLIGTDHVHIVTDGQFRSTERELIHTDHVHIVTDRGPSDTDQVTNIMRLPLNATRHPVCGAAGVSLCTGSVLQHIDREIAKTSHVHFGAARVALSNRRVLGVAEIETTSNCRRGLHACNALRAA